jgi:hypothetical protein
VSNFHLQEIETLQNSLREREEYVTKLEARIKRLEEAGHELLYDNDNMENINRWHKAKEAKL